MECSKCGKVQDHGAVKNKRHRKCGGSQGAALKSKDKKLPKADRGVWQ
jgi:hypothetical protein